MRKKKEQVLNFENLDIDNEASIDKDESDEIDSESPINVDSVEEYVDENDHKRIRRKPKWFDDYET